MVIALLLTFALVVPAKIENVKAVVDDFHLYGSYLTGWGLSPSSTMSPGPTLTVNFSDEVNLTLTNLDTDVYASTHQFLLSYHNSSDAQAGDPVSVFIAGGATVIFTFTANVSGTFTYYCRFHPGIMYGTFVVSPVVPEYSAPMVLSIFMIVIVSFAFVKRKSLFRRSSYEKR